MRRKVRLATLGLVEDDTTEVDTLPFNPESSTENKEPNTEEADYLWRNEFIVVKKSPLGGYGAFAARDLQYGEIILVEKPLVRTVQVSLIEAIDALDLEEKVLFVNLAKFPPVEDCGLSLVERVRRANA